MSSNYFKQTFEPFIVAHFLSFSFTRFNDEASFLFK